jgi:hypothetical protein
VQATAATPTHLPWIGVVGSLLSIAAAQAMIPEQAGIQGALQFTAIIFALCLGAAPVLAGLMSARNFFCAENVIALCPIYWVLLDLIQASYEMPGIRRDDALAVFNMIGVYYCLYWIGTAGRKWRTPKALRVLGASRPNNETLVKIGLWMFVLGMMAFAIPSKFNPVVMYEGLMRDRWSAPWARSGIGGWNAFADHMAYFGYLLPTVTAMVFRRLGWGSMSGWLLTSCSLVFFVFVSQGGSRRIVGACVLAAMIYYLLDVPKLKKWHLVMAGIMVAGLLWVMQIMLASRNMGYANVGAVAGYVTDSMTGKTQTKLSKLAVDDNFYRMAQLSQVMPKPYAFVGHEYVLYVLARPIPRVLWKNKPTHGGFALHYLVQEGASLSVTIIGEWYMSYGLLACAFGGWFMGKLTGLGSVYFQAGRGSFGTMVYGYLIAWLIVGFRSMQELVLFSYPLLAMMLLSRYMTPHFLEAGGQSALQPRRR